MDLQQFEQLKQRFQKGDVEQKIDIYVSTQGLNQEQYMQLLRLFPREHIPKLEAALQ
ncbi:MAG: hypothetical protein GX308_04995 [Epulopiscium sp.]|nr:hypothetical protein [Candidatus Epulonipiscium sp.]